MFHGRSFIGGVLFQDGGAPFRAISPLTGAELEPEFLACDGRAADEALATAEEAFPAFRAVSAEVRAKLLDGIGEEILALGDALLERAHLETGLPLDRLTGERGRTVGQLKLFADVIREGSYCDARIDTSLPERKPLPRPDLRRMLVPLGPVVVFGASNFPLAFSVAGGDTASAFAAGCPVIVKAHEAHPGTSELVAGAICRAIEGCELPSGIFSMLHGRGADVGISLVQHRLTRAVGFTGSRTAGRALFDAAVRRADPIPVFAEMSSLNPVFVLPNALADRGAQIAQALKASVTIGVGQFCTKPGLVFGIGGAPLQAFASSLAEAIRATPAGTMLHGGIRRAYESGLDTVAKIPGVVALAMSDVNGDPKRTEGEAAVFATDSADFLRHRQLHEEVFGPYTLLITARDLPAMIEAARALEGQLTATVHATPEDLANAGELLSILERKAGRLLMNGFPTGVEVCPSMHHGGPYPATTDERFTSVGTAAIQRWLRPVCYQNFPASALPTELTDANPRGIMRLVNGSLTREAIAGV